MEEVVEEEKVVVVVWEKRLWEEEVVFTQRLWSINTYL